MTNIRLFPVTIELHGDIGVPDRVIVERLNALLERERQREREPYRIGEMLPYPIDVVVRPFTAGPPAEPPFARPAPPDTATAREVRKPDRRADKRRRADKLADAIEPRTKPRRRSP